MVIGLTGKIGSGKSSCAAVLSEYGLHHVEVDRIGHAYLQKPGPVLSLLKRFMPELFDKGKLRTRSDIASIVFQDQNKLMRLNQVLHPYMIAEVKQIVKSTNNVVLDAALLFQMRLNQWCDYVIYVNVDKDNASKRVERTFPYFESIWKLQSQLDTIQNKCDYVFDNNSNITDFQVFLDKIPFMGQLHKEL